MHMCQAAAALHIALAEQSGLALVLQAHYALADHIRLPGGECRCSCLQLCVWVVEHF